MHNADKYAYLSFFVPLLVYVITLNGVFQSDYPTSVLGTQWAMWEYHSFSLNPLGSLVVQTVDKGLLNGQYYSAISPGLAILSFPFAGLGFILDGNTFSVFGSALVLDELFLAITGALAMSITYKICRFYTRPLPSFIAALTLAFGTSVWPFTTMLFVQDASLLFSVLAVYLVLRYTKRERKTPVQLVLAGVSLGVSFFVEYVAGLLIIPILAYLILTKARTRDVLPTLYGFLIGPFLQLSYNYGVFGNPLLFPEQLKGDASQSLLGRFDPLGILLHTLLYVDSPYRGLLLFSPVIAFGIYGLYKMYDSDDTKLDAILFFSLFLAVILPYAAWQDWAGGQVYGPRFLILGLPYLAIPIAAVLARSQSTLLKSGFVFLFILSSFIEGAGALTTAISVAGNGSSSPPIELNIPWLLEGKLDSWWVGKLSGAGASTFELISVALFISLWCMMAFLVNRMAKHRTEV